MNFLQYQETIEILVLSTPLFVVKGEILESPSDKITKT